MAGCVVKTRCDIQSWRRRSCPTSINEFRPSWARSAFLLASAPLDIAASGGTHLGREKTAIRRRFFFGPLIPIINTWVSGNFVASKLISALRFAVRFASRSLLSFECPPADPQPRAFLFPERRALSWPTVPTVSRTGAVSTVAILGAARGAQSESAATSPSATTYPAERPTASVANSRISRRRSALEQLRHLISRSVSENSTSGRGKNSRARRRSFSSRRSSASADRSCSKSMLSMAGRCRLAETSPRGRTLRQTFEKRPKVRVGLLHRRASAPGLGAGASFFQVTAERRIP